MSAFHPKRTLSVVRAMAPWVSGEEHNPFGGFLFSGSDEALARLAKAAESEGVKLVAVDPGDGVIRLCLRADRAFGGAGTGLVNRAQAGEFGEVSLGLFGGTVQPPH